MADMLALPSELRQHILKLCFPDSITLDGRWPDSFTTLLQINRLLRSDMGQLIPTWSPLVYISHAATVQQLPLHRVQINGKQCHPRLDRLVLNIFHKFNVNYMRSSRLGVVSPTDWTHPQLNPSWSVQVGHLPPRAREILIDITPAPTHLRKKNGVIPRTLVEDRRTSMFLRWHMPRIADFARCIHEHYHGRVPVRLTGQLCERMDWLVTGVRHHARFDIDFIGTFITVHEAKMMELTSAVWLIASDPRFTSDPRRSKNLAYSRLSDMQWARETRDMYARAANHDDRREATFADLKKLLGFLIDDDALILPLEPVVTVRRTLLLQMANDMGLRTVCKGAEGERGIVVTKPWSEGELIAKMQPPW